MASNPSPPKIRSACETCHRRKIRCIMAPGDTACVNCIHGGVACVFAQRSKCGRPKGTSNSKSKAPRRSEDDHEALSQTNQQQPSPDFSNHGIDQKHVDIPDLDPLDSDLNSYMAWNTMDDLSAPTQSDANNWPLSLPTSPDSCFTSSSSFPNLSAFPMTPPYSTAATPYSMGPPPPTSHCADSDELGFDAALDICKRLDECCRQIGDWAFLPSSNHEIFPLASRLCSAVTMSGHCPAAALIVAGVLKSVELCGLLIARLSHLPPLACNPSAADHTGLFFLLQKIDLLLLQSRIFLVRAGQSAGAQKATELHQHVEATLSRDFAGWSW